MAKSIRKTEATSNENLRVILDEFQSFAVDLLLNSGGLVIGSGSKKKVKIANTVYAMIDGVPVKKTTAEVDFTATTHDVTNAYFRFFVLSMDASGTVTITAGDEAATIGAATIPALPDEEVALGLVLINPTGTGDFDATTTDLDDVTVVPGAVYINTPYPFNQNLVTL